MLRTVLVLLVGAAAGAAVTYYLVSTETIPVAGPMPARARPTRQADEPARAAARPSATDSPAIAEQLAVYELAAATDLGGLRRRIEAEAARSPSASRRFTLRVLLARMAEIDPGEAVRLAVTLALDEPQLVPVFRSLARDDAAAAWRAVGRIDEPALARSIALSLLAVLGYDAPNIERALAAIPTVDASRFEVDALGLFAADDPEAALAAAIAIPARDTRSLAIDAVVRVWAKTDPVAALARVDDLADSELRQPARYGILQQWAAQDPIAALEHFGAQEGFAFGPAGPALVPIMQQLAAADPHELLAAAARLPGQARMMAKQVALQRLALVDPGAAIAYVEREASGIERQRLLASIANGYGRTDPEAALAWARSVQPPVQGLMAAVLTGIAQKDPERALALALAEDPFGRAPTVQMVVTTAVASGATEVATLADRLLSLPDSPARQRALGSLATSWAQTDGERFVSWLVANGARLPIEALRGAANVLPQQNPDIAAAYVDQVPGALRADWIAATASGYSRVDPERALVWLDRFRGEHPEWWPTGRGHPC